MYDFMPPYYGAAYYPEAFPREEIDADLDRLVSHGLNTVRIGEFAWSTMEPTEGQYDFSLFREVVDKCRARGISVIMCTPSATPPAWMGKKYPQIYELCDTIRAGHGSRRAVCPTDPMYRRLCANIVEAMAKEFAADENIIGWQIDNELSIMRREGGCSCSTCAEGFRTFLRKRFHNDIDELNDAWGHYTWSMNFSCFDEIDPGVCTSNSLPAVHKYMWELYKSLCTSDFCRVQADILRAYTDKPIGTDMMPTHQMDIAEANSHLDIIQVNNYDGPSNYLQFWCDAYRSQKDRPFWMTETSTCWNGGNTPLGSRRHGFCKANTLLPFASGAEMVLYWLFRSHRGGYEMSHGSVVDAWGRDMQCSPEVREIARLIDKLRPDIAHPRVEHGGMAIEFAHLPYAMDNHASFQTFNYLRQPQSCLRYEEDILQRIYTPLVDEHFRPDVISAYKDLSPYKLLITHRHLTLDEGDFLERILPWVKQGGTWLVGPYCDIVTKDLAKYKNGPIGHLEALTKVTRAYYIPAPEQQGHHPAANGGCLPTLTFADGSIAHTVGMLCCDALVPGDGVETLAAYTAGTEYLEGYAAITQTRIGKGRIILMGVQLDPADYRLFVKKIAAECGITPITQADTNVRVSLLHTKGGTIFTAIEGEARSAKVAIPFDCVDLETEQTYTAGQVVDMEPYRCIFAKKY